MNAAKSELQQSIRDANATIEALQGTVTDLSTALQTTKDDLATTQTKAEQLEGLLRIYAAATAKDTQFTLFRLTSSKNKVLTSNSQQDETFNLLNGFSATLNFNIEDDPNWRASAYSELLFNGKVVSNERSYTGTVNSNLTVKHRNTLTGKESATKTIRFVEAAEPDKNPTGLSWLTQADSNNIINWRSHLPELTAATNSANGQVDLGSWEQVLQYSIDDKNWNPVIYDFATMFGNESKIYLQVKCTLHDIIGNSKECIINLGDYTKDQFQYDYTEYSINSIATVKDNGTTSESFTLYGLKSSDISVDDLLSKNSIGVTSTGGGLGSTNFSISASQIVVEDAIYTYQASLSTSTQRVYRNTYKKDIGIAFIDVTRDITLTINSNFSTPYYAVK